MIFETHSARGHGRAVHLLGDALPSAWLLRHGPRDRPRVALTFDDGPDAMTSAYLDELDRLDVRATFFVVGTLCLRRPTDLLSIVGRGHEVGAHGWWHRPFTALRTKEILDGLRRFDGILPPPTWRRLVRPPNGGIDARAVLAIASAGASVVLWSVDSGDWCARAPDELVRNVACARPGDVVLLHEGQQWTLDGLRDVVTRLRDRGLDFVTISELARG
jgi:peptidoglycan/xylan/chitin deacetylase (PgdA/CDA1 family)